MKTEQEVRAAQLSQINRIRENLYAMDLLLATLSSDVPSYATIVKMRQHAQAMCHAAWDVAAYHSVLSEGPAPKANGDDHATT